MTTLADILYEHVGEPIRAEFEVVLLGPSPVALRISAKVGSRWSKVDPLIFPPKDSTTPRGDLLRALASALDEIDTTPCPLGSCCLPARHRGLHDIRPAEAVSSP